MKIETRFNIGDVVYFMDDERLKKGQISAIDFFVGKRVDKTGGIIHTKEPIIINYVKNNPIPLRDNDLFVTKEALVDSIEI